MSKTVAAEHFYASNREIARLEAELTEAREEIDTLCQAIEGRRCGSLTNDGLWHYVEKARKLLAAGHGVTKEW